MARTWRNGDLIDLDPTAAAAKEARRQADIAAAAAEAPARAGAAKAAARREAVQTDLGDVFDQIDVVLEGLDALARGDPLPAQTTAAIAKLRAIKAAHPKG